MIVRSTTLLLVLMVLGLQDGSASHAGTEESAPTSTARPAANQWLPFVITGIDAYLHSYPLATTDTTETIAEFMLMGGIEGRSERQAKHRWRLRAEGSVGTELYRQRLEGDYRLLDGGRATRLRVNGSLWGRQYRQDTEYSLSSDNLESRLDARIYPVVGATAALEVRGYGGFLRYGTPSTLEVNYRDLGAGVFVRSTGLSDKLWGIGIRNTARAYPDTAEINRDSWAVEGDYEAQDLDGQGLRVFHKSERRLIADDTVRPSAWTHWTDFSGAVRAARGHMVLELQSEVWRYDEEMSAYFDSWRLKPVLFYRWGDILAATWQLGLATERLDAGDSPETYTQLGLRFGIESYASDLTGSLTLEYGRRTYEQGVAVGTDATDITDPFGDSVLSYTDFNYWEIWLMATWSLGTHFSIDVLASYEPESHTEQTENTALGFGSLRLIWRP